MTRSARFCVMCGAPIAPYVGPGRPRITCSAGCADERAERGTGRPRGRPPGLVDVDRAERMLVAYVNDGMTLEQIGQRHGVTRERVRQIIDRHDRALVQLHLRRCKARTRLRKFVHDTRCPHVLHCRLCGEVFESTNERAAFCDQIHRKVWLAYFRFHVDEDFHEKQRLTITRWQVEKGGRSDVHLRNLEAGTAATKGRWLVFGSTTWHWAVRAYHCGWPVFAELPEQIQQQIRDHEGPTLREREAS